MVTLVAAKREYVDSISLRICTIELYCRLVLLSGRQENNKVRWKRCDVDHSGFFTRFRLKWYVIVYSRMLSILLTLY